MIKDGVVERQLLFCPCGRVIYRKHVVTVQEAEHV